MIAGFQDLQHRGVGLGLGGMVGPGDRLQLAPGRHLRRLGQRAARQRRRDEVDHIGRVYAQPKLAQQRLVLANQRWIRPQERLHGVPAHWNLCLGLGFRLAALRRPHLVPRTRGHALRLGRGADGS